ncbi:MAG: hypothetical protein HYV90_06060 [Candidatus Woesebacteria bacterium]|nr:MAG: hypothetical protein HYV90_06060 [Candidatus Woesebacteria bacterium]
MAKIQYGLQHIHQTLTSFLVAYPNWKSVFGKKDEDDSLILLCDFQPVVTITKILGENEFLFQLTNLDHFKELSQIALDLERFVEVSITIRTP